MGHPVVMGRRTFDSIGKPLSGRSNVVLTRDTRWSAPGVVIAHTLVEAVTLATDLPGGDHVMVIGGGEIYAQAIPFAHQLDLSEIQLEPVGDTHFPEFDTVEWRLADVSDRGTFITRTWRRIAPTALLSSRTPALLAV